MTEQLVPYRTLALIVTLCITCTGCESSEGTVASADPQFRSVGRLLLEYSRANGGKYPASQDDFVEYLGANRSRLGIADDVDIQSLLVSPRDGKPLVIVPGDQVGPTGPSSVMPIVAFESEGVDNLRKTITARGGVFEIESSEIEQIFPNIK